MPTPQSQTFNIAVLLSSNGSTLLNLIQHIQSQFLKNVQITLVISSNPQAKGILVAQNANIPCKIIPYSQYKSHPHHFSQTITQTLDSFPINLIVFAGFLSFYHVPTHYSNRIINIHPSLIPAFSGKQFYGLKVHQAVINSGTKITGCTVHFVDNQYDHGPIISQASIPVSILDTPQSLSKKVKILENLLYPHIIRAFAENRIHISHQKVFIS